MPSYNNSIKLLSTPNLMGVIQSESMISQAFQVCYSIEGYLSNCCVLSLDQVGYCHDFAKWLSHYLYFFSFFSFTLDLLYKRECRKVLCHKCHKVTVIWQEVTTSHHMMSHDGSHDRHGKVVHRLCSSCISSVENLTETLLSSPCQMLIKGQLALF